ncbi:hypothetical protein [Paludisphaera mucosa]|uniref:Uncharacterized protein n=1 Tax=Paludisphaera mucosa TaxID=3030827 RepID=A0ABT6FFF2_9BACT|nr:hypothetical protein [Paludisphaera mucosa]MDG3006308.1 hypothetical protein [Paludisphaera mucosa]
MADEVIVYTLVPALGTSELRRYAAWEDWEIRVVDILKAQAIPSETTSETPLSGLPFCTVFGWPSSERKMTEEVDRTLQSGDVEAIRGLYSIHRTPRLGHVGLSCFDQPGGESPLDAGREEDLLTYAPKHRRRASRTVYSLGASRFDPPEAVCLRELLVKLIRGATGGVGDEPQPHLRR